MPVVQPVKSLSHKVRAAAQPRSQLHAQPLNAISQTTPPPARPSTACRAMPTTPSRSQHKLIETNPVPTDLGSASSDYLLAGLGYKPGRESAKRLRRAV